MLIFGNTSTGIARVVVTNNDYGLSTLPTVINEADYVVNGLSVGNPIVVIGEVATSDSTGPITVHARQIVYGTRDDLVQQMQRMHWPGLRCCSHAHPRWSAHFAARPFAAKTRTPCAEYW